MSFSSSNFFVLGELQLVAAIIFEKDFEFFNESIT
jgi:hypothetical protein